MIRSIAIVIMIILVCVITACSSQQINNVANDEDVSITWPSVTQDARIRFLQTFSRPEELGIRPTPFKRLLTAITGAKETGMLRPYAIAVRDQTIVIGDPGKHAVHVYDTANSRYRIISMVDDEQLQSPVGVALGRDRMFVADSVLGKVFVLDQDGKKLSTIKGLKRPTGLAYDLTRNHLFVTDTLAHRIVVFDDSGQKIREIGKRGTGTAEFNFPSHIHISDDKLIVNDSMNFRIQTFDLAGKFLSLFGTHGDGSGTLSQPKGVALDSDGNVYVAGATIDRVQIFSAEGTFLLAFGRKGNGPGEFLMPSGITVTEDLIYVADSLNQRIQVFQYTGGD